MPKPSTRLCNWRSITRIIESCRTYKWGMSPYKWVVSRVWMASFTCATQQRSITRITQQMHMCVQLSWLNKCICVFNWVATQDWVATSIELIDFNWVNWLQLSCATQQMRTCERTHSYGVIPRYECIHKCNLTQFYGLTPYRQHTTHTIVTHTIVTHTTFSHSMTPYRQLFDIWVETLWHCVGVSRTGARHSICRGPVCEQRLRLPIFICK